METARGEAMREVAPGGRAEAGIFELLPEEMDLEELQEFGTILDFCPARLRGQTVGTMLAENLLLVRTRDGWTAPLKANAAQLAFERRRGRRNIVLKARQMGMTTWAAARFFLKTITQPGTLTLEVAHTQQAAEEIFRIVHRSWTGCPRSCGMARCGRRGRMCGNWCFLTWIRSTRWSRRGIAMRGED